MRSPLFWPSALALLSALVACGNVNIDAGSDHPHGLLPIDERNPVIVLNEDAFHNWDGEYALTFAGAKITDLLGIVVTSTSYYPDIDSNVGGWRNMVEAARSSGLSNIPDPVASTGPLLVRPDNGDIDATEPNRSPGAQLILDLAAERSEPLRPVVLVVGTRLTEVADAYLMDPSIVERVVVVATVGAVTADGSSASMTLPNGDIDTWADEIVLRRFRYVQVNAFYAEQGDFTASDLPANPFGAWITAKIGNIHSALSSCDQISVMACALPDFALAVTRMSEASSAAPAKGMVPSLAPDLEGSAWVVTRGDTAGAAAQLRQYLNNPATFGVSR